MGIIAGVTFGIAFSQVGWRLHLEETGIYQIPETNFIIFFKHLKIFYTFILNILIYLFLLFKNVVHLQYLNFLF